jgi:hypothetical protein
MATCEVCGNDYDKTIEIVIAEERHVFDSFECCAHCAHRAGVAAAQDRV